MKKRKLNPCPICGGNVVLDEYSDGSGHIACHSCRINFGTWGKFCEGKAHTIMKYERMARSYNRRQSCKVED